MLLFLIILVVLFLCWPMISRLLSRWFSGFMARRTEDMLRRMMGMPSRKEEKRASGRSSASTNAGGTSGSRYHREPRTDAATLLKSVAVDVDYTEIKEFGTDPVRGEEGNRSRKYDEEQVSDVEYMEIRE